MSGTVRVTGMRYAGTVSIRDAERHALHGVGVRLTLGTGRGHRTVLRTRLRAVVPGRLLHLRVRGRVPAGLPAGRLAIEACAGWPVRCAITGRLQVAAPSRRSAVTTPGQSTTSSSSSSSSSSMTSSPITTARPSTVPSSPISYSVDQPKEVTAGGVHYWVIVPAKYDRSGQTPMKLFVWLHGCGARASGDIWNLAANASRGYLAIADAEHEGGCWNSTRDQSPILADIADVEHHFNVAPRQISIGGYSSGGDMAYRMMFDHANFFAGMLAENAEPFGDSGYSAAQAEAASARRFPVVHMAHDSDGYYSLSSVESQINQLRAAGWSAVTFLHRSGTHYDATGQNGYDGTNADLEYFLLPHIDNDGWMAPGG